MKSSNTFLAKAIFVFITLFSTGSFVQAQKQIAEIYPGNQVQYIGIDGDNRLVFELRLTNLQENGSVLRILDSDRNVLLQERINAKTYFKRYKIDRSEMNRIYFEVINKQTLFKEMFQLNYMLEEKWEVIKA